MARRYVHFSARDLEETVLEIHGLKETQRSNGIMKPIQCPRCGSINPRTTLDVGTVVTYWIGA